MEKPEAKTLQYYYLSDVESFLAQYDRSLANRFIDVITDECANDSYSNFWPESYLEKSSWMDQSSCEAVIWAFEKLGWEGPEKRTFWISW